MADTVTTMQGKRILLVEDEYYIAEEMRAEFEAFGAAVVGPVAATEDALDIVENYGPLDGAVLDINLQGEVSYPVADALMKRGVPFVFATGYDRSTVPDSYSAVPVWHKPVHPKSVGEALFG